MATLLTAVVTAGCFPSDDGDVAASTTTPDPMVSTTTTGAASLAQVAEEAIAALLGGVNVADAGLACHPLDDAGQLVALDGAPVIGDEVAVGADVVDVGGAPALEELDELGVQRHEAVVAQLAHRDAQPVTRADADHGIGVEAAGFVGP